MSAEIAQHLRKRELDRPRAVTRPSRVRIVLALGPLTMLVGVVWAIAQPYRITLLHPFGQGFWWLLSEPPLFVVLAGFVFWRVVAVPLAEDIERP